MGNEITPERIINLVADNFGCSVEEIKGIDRARKLVLRRFLAIRLVEAYTDISLRSIGMFFSGRDHSSIIYACRECGNIISRGELEEKKIKKILNQLNVELDTNISIYSLLEYERGLGHRPKNRPDYYMLRKYGYSFYVENCEKRKGSIAA